MNTKEEALHHERHDWTSTMKSVHNNAPVDSETRKRKPLLFTIDINIWTTSDMHKNTQINSKRNSKIAATLTPIDKLSSY